MGLFTPVLEAFLAKCSVTQDVCVINCLKITKKDSG